MSNKCSFCGEPQVVFTGVGGSKYCEECVQGLMDEANERKNRGDDY